MVAKYRLKSGQINYESQESKGAFACIVIRDGVFHNLSEDQRLDLIRILEDYAPDAPSARKKQTVDLEDMF